MGRAEQGGSPGEGKSMGLLLKGLQRVSVSAQGLHQIPLHRAAAPAQWEDIETYLTLPITALGLL